MIGEPLIKIGIITNGKPVLTKNGDSTIVHNVLIGKGFHWQQEIVAEYKGISKNLNSCQDDIQIISSLPIEDYLRSVIGSEMNPSAPLEFLKAHAVISRSWSIRKIINKNNYRSSTDGLIRWEESDIHEGFDVCSDDHCQRYQGIIKNQIARIGEAIDSTRGQVIVDSNGEICDARFSKCCGGKTEIFSTCWAENNYDYLKSIKDPWCDLTDLNEFDRSFFLSRILKNYDRSTIQFRNWECRIDKKSLSHRIKLHFGIDVGNILDMKKLICGESGRIKTLKIIGDKDSIIVGKELSIRKLMSDDCLYSSWFDIKNNGNHFILNGHGWGHGVGLCQIGAAHMAEHGYSYDEILKYYYQNIHIKTLYD